jgi:hypothetical protein
MTKSLAGLLLLVLLAACRAAPSAPARPRLSEPSGLAEVTLLAKGLE